MNTTIELKNITTGYNKYTPLLKNFSYSFSEGIYGVLGCSGIGKTTLLRTIAGLMKPVAGEVYINNKKIDSPEKNDVYMMHQSYTSFDWLKCIDNILISKKIKSKVTQEDVESAKKMLELVELNGYEDKYPQQLSGGQRQRLALARTLFMQPKIILMDEPLSALDSTTRSRMQQLIVDIQKKNDSTIIMVTHSEDEAEKMCENILRLA